MTRADQAVDRAADRLHQAAHKAAARGGVAAKLAGELAQDAAFLRKLKPSLVMSRADHPAFAPKGEAPTDQRPGAGVAAPSGPQVRSRAKTRGGPNPFVVVGVALAAGILLAKILDWRGRAHPRG